METNLSLFKMPHLASRCFNHPLAIEPGKLEVLKRVLLPRFGVDMVNGVPIVPLSEIPPPRNALTAQKDNERPYGMRGNTAVIPVFGTLVHRMGSMDALSGLTSYERLRQLIEHSEQDKAVKRRLLYVDSGGGEASGLADFMTFLRDSAERKPLDTYTDGMAASAAYGIFSTGQTRSISQDAILGSIGVRLLHVDQTAFNERLGLVVTEFHAGARKTDYSPHESLTEEKITHIQALVDDFYDIFTRQVAFMLDISQQEVRDTEAGLFVGRKAVDAKLAQTIATLDDVLEVTTNRAASSTQARATMRRSISMSHEVTTIADLEASYPELIRQIRQDAKTQGVQTGTEAERERVREIFDLAPVGCETLARTCAFTTPCAVAEATKKFLLQQKEDGPRRLATFRDDAPEAVRTTLRNEEQSPALSAIERAAHAYNETSERKRYAVIPGKRA